MSALPIDRKVTIESTRPIDRGRIRVSRLARRTGIILGIAVALGGLEVATGRVRHPRAPLGRFAAEAFGMAFPFWLILAILLPAIILITRRLRVDRHTWRVAIPLHLVSGALFAILHIGLSSVVETWRTPSASAWQVFTILFSGYGVMDLFTYGAIVAGLHAADSQLDVQARETTASELRASLADARLRALRAQLNPHFLFNAMNSISALALQGERQRVVETVSSLSDVLRLSLAETQAHEVTLAGEIEFLDHYLDVERVRFGDRLAFEVRVDADLRPALVPPLLLQPLVENAIRHGIAGRRGPGRVIVEGVREDDGLRIEVRDTGPGFGAASTAGFGGIGLANTRERLQQLYGDRHSIDLGVAPEGGARVTVRLPLRLGPCPLPNSTSGEMEGAG